MNWPNWPKWRGISNLRVQMDGARFANAVVSLGVTPKELTWEAGVDVLCFGGTKNGLAVGEAVVFFNRELAREFDYRCKQGGQLASKMRFLSAPWVGMLAGRRVVAARETLQRHGPAARDGDSTVARREGFLRRSKAMLCLRAFPKRWWKKCTSGAGNSTPTWGAGRIRG